MMSRSLDASSVPPLLEPEQINEGGREGGREGKREEGGRGGRRASLN